MSEIRYEEALHEAGHAVVADALGLTPSRRISVTPSGQGVVVTVGDETHTLTPLQALELAEYLEALGL